MVARLDCVETYPEAMKKAIFDNPALVNAFDATFDPLKSFGENIQRFDSRVRSHSQNGAFATAEEMISAAGNSLFDGYHITRLVDPSEVLDHGIQVLDWEPYRARIYAVLSKYTDLDYIEKECLLDRTFNCLYHSDEGTGRYGHLSFFAPASQYVLHKRSDGGFAQLYGQNIGGEFLDRALREYAEYSPLLETLSSIGDKYLIRFQFQMQDLFRDRCDWQYDFLMYTIAFAVLYCRDYGSLPYDCLFASHLRQPVPPQNILSISPLPTISDELY